MLVEILTFLLLGILAGTFTGLAPGIHINLIGAILVSLSATFFSRINPIFLIVFIASMAMAHTFIDFIPGIFLGCPDTDTQLSVLPGHELLKEGKGYEAVMLTAIGGIIAVFVLIIISFPSAFLVSKIYEPIHSVMGFVLLGTSAILILTEKRKLTALFVLATSGILGICVLNLGLKEPLLPLLTGLFGSSMIITSIKNKTKIPKQEITFPKDNLAKPLIGAVIASPLCGFLPGLGSGQAAVLGNSILRTGSRGFLALVGATNVLVMGLSFVSLYAISKTRTGAAAAMQEIIGVLSSKTLVLLLGIILISGIISFSLLKNWQNFLHRK
jgi:putative membrane protein